MELYQLKTFAMVAEEGHLTRAAKRLHASQPAVSAHIKALEDELGLSLFIRTPKGMTLTAEGVQLRKHADKALATIQDMMAHAATLSGAISGDLRIGIHTEPGSLRIPELYSTLQAQHPHLQLHLLQSMTGEALDRLESGELDAAFIYGKPDSEKIFALELQKLKLVIAGPAKWRKKIEDAGPEDLGAFPWIMTPADCPFHTIVSELFRRYDLSPDKVANVDQESTIKTMVKAGTGLSLLLEKDVAIKSDKDDFAVWDMEELYLPLSITCLKRHKDESRIQALFSVISRVWEPARAL